MNGRKVLEVPLNRVEGDLELRVQMNDGVVEDAWSSGAMFRGIETLLVGRNAMDALVLTPRICGICSTTHLTAAAKALDALSHARLTDNALRLRNVALILEHVQSDLRHCFLMFLPDFANPRYSDHPLYLEAVKRYRPWAGESTIQVLRETKELLELFALIGGQWPHSAFIVPGGITSNPASSDLLQCSLILANFRRWYEHRVLGCDLDRWKQVQSWTDLQYWLEENPQQRDSDLGFFLRFARSVGLHTMGKGRGSFFSTGSLEMPSHTGVAAPANAEQLIPSGVFVNGQKYDFDQEKIAEHVAYSWYVDYEGGKHPFEGETKPYASGREGKKYSWAKAPRYDGLPVETGPLAEMIVASHPLITDLVEREGPSAFVRQFARMIRPTTLLPAMDCWLREAERDQEDFYVTPGEITDGAAYGLVEATRGALGHWVRVEQGKIAQYQIITPTAWNASPRDSSGVRGPWEDALIGTEVKDPENPVELGHVVRSFDACLVCTVHTFSKRDTTLRIRF